MNTHGRKRFQTIETFQKVYGVHITTKHSGKMAEFASLSTSPSANRFCAARAKCRGSICEKCYAMRMAKRYSTLETALTRNHDVLTSKVIPVEEMPILNFLMFRLEAFGDVENSTQIVNYFNLCRRNPRVQFSIWTKNVSLFRDIFANGYMGEKVAKPKNLIIIISSPFVNKAEDISSHPFADKVFTVYDEGYAKSHGISINCGSLSCASCQRCYNKADRTRYINELVK